MEVMKREKDLTPQTHFIEVGYRGHPFCRLWLMLCQVGECGQALHPVPALAFPFLFLFAHLAGQSGIDNRKIPWLSNPRTSAKRARNFNPTSIIPYHVGHDAAPSFRQTDIGERIHTLASN